MSNDKLAEALRDAEATVLAFFGEMRVIRWRGRYSPEVGTKLYTGPQPAQDASKYQELLMAVEKKFPGESRHETALRYIRETELQSCEPKCDAAMAKESGR